MKTDDTSPRGMNQYRCNNGRGETGAFKIDFPRAIPSDILFSKGIKRVKKIADRSACQYHGLGCK